MSAFVDTFLRGLVYRSKKTRTMEINGQYLTEDDSWEMLKMLENHLLDHFSARESEVQYLTLDDAKALFESRDNYPDKYWKLIEKLRKKHFHSLKKEVSE